LGSRDAKAEEPFYQDFVTGYQDVKEAKNYEFELETRLTYDFSHPEVADPDNIINTSLLFGRGINNSLILIPTEKKSSTQESDQKRIFKGIIGYSSYFLLTSFAIDNSVSFMTHEYFHEYMLNKYGMKGRLRKIDSKEGYDLNPFSLVAVSLRNIAERGQWRVEIKDRDKFLSEEKYKPYHAKIEAMVVAAGFNGQMMTLEELADSILDGDGSIGDSSLYVTHMSYPARYREGGQDISRYLDYLDSQGMDYSKEHIRALPFVSLLSGSNISLVKGVIGYISDREKGIKPITLKFLDADVYLPELNSFFTSRGPSIKAKERVKKGPLILEMSYERPLSGNVNEFGLNLEYVPNAPLSIGVDTIINTKSARAFDARIGIKPVPIIEKIFEIDSGLLFLQELEFGVDYYYAKGDSLHRERRGKVPVEKDEKESGVKGSMLLRLNF
jgi:hypothetical protein